MQATFFPTQAAFRKWLQKNHKTKKELIVGYYKVDSGKPSITWPQSVDQALCFGWIDGIRRSIDKESYCIRFTPRRSTSNWSAINIKKVKALTRAGLMAAAGKKAFEQRKEGRSGVYSHEKEPVALAPKYQRQFKRNKPAWHFFNEQPPSCKKVMVYWIMSAKQESTRLMRLEKTKKASAGQRRVL